MVDDQILERARAEEWTDEVVVERVLRGDILLFELLMRRHNQRIYRAIRSILRDDSESEDVMQEAYVRAYEHLARFEGRARFSTWITRIAVNEAIRRSVLRGRLDPLESEDPGREDFVMQNLQGDTPESVASNRELASLLEAAILELPDGYRAVVVLRDIEEMSTAETADVLGLSESNVKVRLHRAHEQLRDSLMHAAGGHRGQVLAFHATRCDRVVRGVFARIGADGTASDCGE